MHGLGNLALLQRDFNSKLNNAVFALKRERILELDKAGAYILPCTRNVFLKYYTRAPTSSSRSGAAGPGRLLREAASRRSSRLPASRPCDSALRRGRMTTSTEGLPDHVPRACSTSRSDEPAGHHRDRDPDHPARLRAGPG